MNVKENKFMSLFKRFGWYILVSIFSIVILSPIFGVLFVNPFEEWLDNLIHPPQLNLTIFPNFLPENNIVEIEVQNTGDLPLSNFFIYYRFLCFMNESKGLMLSKQILNPKESGFLEIKVNEIDTNCSIATKPLVVKFYTDKKGRCYNEFVQGTSNFCMYCRTQVNITAIEFQGSKNISKKFEFWYPFFNGTLIYEGETGSCSPIEQANKSELKFEGEFSAIAFDASTYCLKGEDPDWCQAYGYLKYPEVKEIK